MTQPKTEALLKKINYLEAELDIQKQILFSIPSAQKSEMEKTITIIAARKKEIQLLRQELKEHDPAEYDRILVFERAITEFKKIAMDTPFQSIINRNIDEECFLALQNGNNVDCLIKACDAEENWTIITIDGQIRQFPSEDVAEKPSKKNENF